MPAESAAIERELAQAFVANHMPEAARVLEGEPLKERTRHLARESTANAAGLLERMDPSLAAEAVETLRDETLGRILAAMDPLKSSALLARLPVDVRDAKLALVDAELAKELRAIIFYPPNTAGSLMDPRFLGFRATGNVADVIKRMKDLRKGRVLDILLTDDEGRLAGLIPLQTVILATPAMVLSELLTSAPPSVNSMAPREDVVAVLTSTGVTTLPVVSVDGVVQGVIRYESLVQAAREDAMTDLQAMVGVSRDERALSPVFFSVRKRLPWLNINLLTAFVAAAIVGLFEDVIAQITALAVLLPVVAGQSGNTGAQALAVTMRGLALREVRPNQWLRLVLKEMGAGAINGIAIAIVTAIGVYVWSGSPALCGVIGVAMVLSMVVAAAAGAAIPIIISAVGQDPAQSSSIVLTTVTDVIGFLSFLGLASLFVHLL
jgi:magnesium transporter